LVTSLSGGNRAMRSSKTSSIYENERLTLPQRGREACGLRLWGWWMSAGVNCSACLD